jgi:diguanylate cyclase (GGDEF)-like protein/PAS domain S-box-containing protein
LEYFGILGAPTFYFLYAMEYSRLAHWINKRLIFLLVLIPLLNLALIWTNEWHHLFWTAIESNPAFPFVLIFSHGPTYWIGSAFYSFGLIALATVFLFLRAAHISPIFRPNTYIVLVGSMFPVVGNLLYLFNLSPILGLDLTPLVLCLGGSLIVPVVHRFRIFEMIPIARSKLFDALPEGVCVLGGTHQILDVNPAAAEMLGWKDTALFGRPIAESFPDWQNHEPKLAGGGTLEFVPPRNPTKIVEVRSLQLPEDNSVYVLIFRDITDNKHAEEDLQKANQVLRIQLEEIRLLQETLREQAVRDPLTGLYNRRYLAETLDREMARAKRVAEPVSVVIIDLDHFKEINDTYGHRAGDEILRMLGTILSHQTRRGDISCRYGGDEFVVILPGASHHIALQRAEQWRIAFSTTAFADGNTTLYNTFSAGLALFPDDGKSAEEILAAADKALYSAKSSGRNRSVASS